MTQCIFHDTGATPRDRKLFEIVERAYAAKEKVVVFCPAESRASDLDRTLWILKQDSFIPHLVLREQESFEEDLPVAITTTETNPTGARTLIADGHCSLEYALSFDVVHEFVDRSSPQIHQACRDRYKSYQSVATVEYSGRT
jgi:DNA polymerase III subunit chi